MSEIEPVPAATVVLVRDAAVVKKTVVNKAVVKKTAANEIAADGIEVLLVQRNSKLVFHGGHWVFPGGRIDQGDFPEGDNNPEYLAAKNAAVRETREEAGIEIKDTDLIHTAHWTTPPNLPRRFSTWFFICPLSKPVAVSVDNDEILDYRWLSPAAAIAEAESGQLVLPRPTLTTLKDLLPYANLQQLVEGINQASIRIFPADSPYYCAPHEKGETQGETGETRGETGQTQGETD
ncbi:MAG: NUDIX hydrolase [Gammaproteobacteria bacterium]|jgi:8-oxo-dGTP pyrophosphatase MutT (NUDIX family)|nr:NUDIX hydrolase [Gammaproteobacteria bacterium]MDP7455697.1 NUDIX hydrolase [Gammaproteobacteria bacterium]HJO11809.1 NUDIX hydrolase [Gammaproteobacteria bacterium]|tara:strand:- start:3005 stop:3709 length:705 start_codon:yes stop_codon:yes gene_type:complete